MMPLPLICRCGGGHQSALLLLATVLFALSLTHNLLCALCSFRYGAQYLEAVSMAVEEINDKTDGLYDDVLPFTEVKFMWHDSAIDTGASVRGAINLLTGREVDVVVGTFASSGTAAVQQILRTQGTPQLSFAR
jgi:putative lipase involved disintegration of autophagic bodies